MPDIIKRFHKNIEALKALFASVDMEQSAITTNEKIYNDTLHKACLKGTFESVEKIVSSNKIYIDSENEAGLTPLGLLALTLYVHRPAEMDWSTVEDLEEKLKFLLKNGADPLKPLSGETTVADFIFRGENKNIISMMLRYIRDINRPLNSIGDTALLISIRKGFYKITKKILAMNADVNRGCFFTDDPLYCAAAFKRTEYISYPVEQGGSAEIRNGLGETPLHVACYNSPEKDIMEKCLGNNPYSYKMDPDSDIPYYTVVFEYDQKTVMTTELVELFLDRGLNVDAKDFRGRSPLHYCFRRSNVQIASIFLWHGAYLDLTTKHSVCLLKYIPTSLKTNEIGKLILKFIAMEICKGNPINETLEQRLGKREEAEDYLKQCYREIDKLKSYRIKNTSVTHWKLLTKSISQLARYTTNYLVVEDIETFDVDSYPIYSTDILYKFEKARKRMKLITECEDILNRYTEWKLPLNCVDMVIDRLSIAEMENLIESGVTGQDIL